MRVFVRSILAVAIAGAIAAAACSRERVHETPNIVLIVADDLGWGDLGSYGATDIRTRHCDRLADQGIRFTDAHSPSSTCSPTRYSVLTGRYGWRTWLKNGIILEHMPLLVEPGRLTLPMMLKGKGYATACVGKWHLGWGSEINADWDGEVAPGPMEVGFDYFFGIPYSQQSSPKQMVYVENRLVVGLKRGESLDDEETLERIKRRFDTTGQALSQVAVSFINRNKDRPFFLYYPTVHVHRPWIPAEFFRGMSDAGIYGDFVSEFDWAVARILKALEDNGLEENTLVIVTSDNGANNAGSGGSHKANGPLRGLKGGIYEGGHRVPFIARWPGHIGPGGESDETICLSDLMATVADIVGYPLPADAGEDSYSIVPALTGLTTDKPIREATVHHSSTGMLAIRQGKWKYIEGRGAGNPATCATTSKAGLRRPTACRASCTTSTPTPPKA
jgi:arylsulfatase A-like enzyme